MFNLLHSSSISQNMESMHNYIKNHLNNLVIWTPWLTIVVLLIQFFFSFPVCLSLIDSGDKDMNSGMVDVENWRRISLFWGTHTITCNFSIMCMKNYVHGRANKLLPFDKGEEQAGRWRSDIVVLASRLWNPMNMMLVSVKEDYPEWVYSVLAKKLWNSSLILKKAPC